jgi:NAD(P)-dependent dehydrogenase (short-subunit alcohol dehydrogenase family)
MSVSNIPYDANEFSGKRILVTGGTRGIGEAIVNRLVRGGATVLATARTIPAGGNSEQFIKRTSARARELITSSRLPSTALADSTF